jgi:hypothetical protein
VALEEQSKPPYALEVAVLTSVPGDSDFVDRGSKYIRACDLGASGRND